MFKSFLTYNFSPLLLSSVLFFSCVAFVFPFDVPLFLILHQPITVKNTSKDTAVLSFFTPKQLREALGESNLAAFIVDDGIIEDRRFRATTMKRTQYTTDDFDLVCFLGQGSFGSVTLVKPVKEEGPPLPPTYALKAMNKEYIFSSGQVEHTLDERDIVVKLSHPNVLRTFSTFQNTNELFLLSEYIAGCDLWAVIVSKKRKERERGGGGRGEKEGEREREKRTSVEMRGEERRGERRASFVASR